MSAYRCFEFAIIASMVTHAVAQSPRDETLGSAKPDRVWLQPAAPTKSQSDWYASAIEIIDGNIVDFDAKQLRVTIEGDDGETIVAASRVIWIRAGKPSPLQASAMELFESGQYAKNLQQLPEVLNERPPVWRQQWFTMVGAVAAWKSSRGKISLELVSQLDRRELPPLMLAWLPIAWHHRSSTADEIASATARIDDPSPATKLVAASWLLSSPDRSRAISELKSIAADTTRPMIASLAQCVLWRSATPPQVKHSFRDWQMQIDALPMVLQTGPSVTLVEKLKSSGLSEAAQSLEWSLELTPIHPHPARLPSE